VGIIVNGLKTGAKVRRKVELGKEKGRKKKIICRKIPKYLVVINEMRNFAARKETNSSR
jgi:hypothetical protein